MNAFRKFTFKRRIAVAVCVIFACLSFIAGLIVFNNENPSKYSGGGTLNKVTDTVEPDVKPEIKALHNYTALEADVYSNGVVIYAKSTTAENLKRNLAVYGTFTDANGSTHKVLLSDSEYTISVKVGDIDPIPLAETALVFPNAQEEIPADTNLTYIVTANGVASQVATVFGSDKIKTETPNYTSITVDNISEIDGDYDKDSIRVSDRFVVKSGTDTVYNREFYQVTELNLNSRTIKVKLNGSDSEVTASINNVRPASIVSASLEIKSELIKDGDYYKIPDENGKATKYSAFAVNMTQKEIFNGLNLTAYYAHSSSPVELAFSSTGILQGQTNSGHTVGWVGGNSPNLSAAGSIELSLNVGSATATVSLTLEAEKVIEIKIKDGYSYSGKLNPYTPAPVASLDGWVIPVYNSDYYKDTTFERSPLQSGEYTISDPLTPDAETLGTGLSDGDIYTKTVNVVYSEDNTVTTNVTFNVTMSSPTLMFEAGSFAQQTYTKPFDYSGLSMFFNYGRNSVTAPLSDFVSENSEHIKLTFYPKEDYTGTPIDNGRLTKEVKSVRVLYRYDTKVDFTPNADGSYKSGIYVFQATTGKISDGDEISQQLIINKLRLPVPVINTSAQSYRDGLTKEFSFSDELDADIINRITVVLERKVAGEWVNQTINSTEVLNSKSVPISEGGEYRISFKLADEDLKEVSWNVGEGSTAAFEFIVNPSDIDLTVNLTKNSWNYGTDFTSYITINGTPRGLTTEYIIGSGEGQLNLPYRILYYPVGGGDGVEFPENVGKYYAVADTKATDTYNAATSPAPNPYSGAPVITVTAKSLDLTQLTKTITYDGTAHSVSEFVKPEGFVNGITVNYTVYGEANTFEYTDTFEDVIDTSVLNQEYTHVSENPAKPLNISILADNNNYVWQGVTGKQNTLNVEITAREFEVNVRVDNFVYGGKQTGDRTQDYALAPVFTYTDKTDNKSSTDETDYFAVKDVTYKTGEVVVNSSDYKSWNAGSYTVNFGWDQKVEHEADDINVVCNQGSFEVLRAWLDKVTLGDADGETTYSRDEQDVKFNNWQAGLMKIETTAKQLGENGAASEDELTVGFTGTLTDNTLSVTYAGEYTIKVSLISNNYDWKPEEGVQQSHDPISFTYTVNKAKIEFNWSTDESSQQFVPAQNQIFPTATATGIAFDDGITLKVGVYDESDKLIGNAPDPGVIAAGKFNLKIASFATESVDGSYNLALNYILGENVTKDFEILSADLDPIVLINATGTTSKTITVEYKGEEWIMSDFVEDWTKYVYGTDSLKLKISVTATDSDYFADGKIIDVNTYTVTLTPADNFSWGEGGTGDSVFTVVITQKVISGEDISWSNTALTYNGQEQKPVATPDNLFAIDKGKVGISVTGGQTDASATSYTATANELTDVDGGRARNYKLPDTKTTTKFTIAKYAVAKPSKAFTGGTFGNENKVAYTFTDPSISGWAWNEKVSVTIGGKYNFGGVDKNHTDTYTFDWGSKSFNAKNAGQYTVTFTLTDVTNLCWAEEGESESVYIAPKIDIARKQIIAPTITRSKQHDGYVFAPSVFDWNSGFTPTENFFTATYGTFNKTDMTYPEEETSNSAVNEYYVRLKINGDNALNYVWVLADDSTVPELSNSIITQNGKCEYADGNVSVYLNYAITLQVLSLDYTVNNYDFGDNAINAIERKSITGVIVLTGNDLDLLNSGSYSHIGYTQTITFKKGETTEGVVTIVKGSDPAVTGTYTNLENFIPWSSGTYTVEISLVFEGGILQPLTFTRTLTVNKKVLTADDVVWSGSDNVEYDGLPHTFTATFNKNNMPLRSDETSDTVVLPALTVENVEEGMTELPKNARSTAYTLGIKTDDANFALPQDYITKQLTITPHKVTVSGLDGSRVYGTETQNKNSLWKLADGSSFCNGENGSSFISVKIVDGNNNEIVKSTGVGEYSVIPYLNGTSGSSNYTLEVSANGTFIIEARQITVSLKENLSSVYGTTVTLDNAYTVTWANGSPDESWLADDDGVEDVFTLSSPATDANASEGSYAVIVTVVTNGNYTVTGGGVYENKYTITNAEFTATAEGYEKPYDGKEHTLVALASESDRLIGITLSGETIGNNTVKFSYSTAESKPEINGAWTNAENLKFKDTSASGNYWIKIEIDNHESIILDSAVTVTISKVQLTVSLALEIFYGENSPANYDGESNVYLGNSSSLTDSRYTVNGFVNGEGVGAAGINGTISYTTDYKKGDSVKYSDDESYALVLDVSNLSSTNYTFTAGAGTLKVKPLTVEVSFKNEEISAVYWSLVGEALPYTNYFNVNVTADSTYDSTNKVMLYGNYSDIFDVTSEAFKIADGQVTSMGGVKADGYTVTLTANSANYSAGTLPSGRFIITPASLTVNADAVNDLSAVYKEDNYSLTGDIDVTTVDNCASEIKYYYSVTDEITDFTTVTDWTEKMPQFIDVGKYYVYFRITADNHTTWYVTKTVEITIANNSFNTSFSFGNAGWTYGTGCGNITEAKADFDRDPVTSSDTNSVKYTLYTGTYTLENIPAEGGTSGTLDNLFPDSAKKLSAGSYTLYYKVDGNTNYKAVEAVYTFTVTKKSLTITVNSISVVYGDDLKDSDYYDNNNANGYNFTVAGLENGETNADIFADGKLPVFTSSYQKGYKNGSVKDGGYDITLSNQSQLTSVNYEVTFNTDNKLTVTQRNVNLTIAGLTAKYNLNAASGTTGSAPTLKFTVSNMVDGNGSSSDGSGIIELVTNAVNGSTTLEVGAYPIIARFTEDYKDHAGNYAFTFSGTMFNQEVAGDKWSVAQDYIDTLTNVIGGLENGAGVYTITPAELALVPSNLGYFEGNNFVEYPENVNGTIYDGRNKGHTATAADDYGNETFYAVYATSFEGLSSATDRYAVNEGTYYYKFVVENSNYTWTPSQNNRFIIYQRELTASVSLTDSVNPARDPSYSATYKDIVQNDNNSYNLTYTFGNLVVGESLAQDANGFVYNVQAAVLSGSTFENNVLNGTYTGKFENGVFTLNAVNAGTYKVTLSLGDSNKNYTFGTQADTDSNGNISFTFTINRKALTVTAQNSSIQYGSPLTDTTRFDGFKLSQNILDIASRENGKISNSFNISGVGYTTEYKPASSKAGDSFNIVPQATTIKSLNYEIVTSGTGVNYGKLTVTQRQVTVTLNGYTGTSTQSWAGEEYTGNPLQPDLSGNNVGQFLSVVTQNWYGNTGDSSSGIVDCAKIVLSVNNDAVNVGKYPMFICQSDANTNYLVNFVNNGNTLATGTAHNNELDEALRPVFNIRPKALTVQVVLNGTENQTSFNIIYGNNADTYYDVTYGGLVERDRVAGDNHKFNIDGGLIVSNNIQYRAVRSGMATEYNPWVSNAVEVYTVSASGLDLHNYTITFKPATMTVVPRPVIATVTDREFTSIAGNGGVFGIKHDAPVTFVDDTTVKVDGFAINNTAYYGDAFSYNPVISRVYTGYGFDGSQLNSSADAPTKAGTYEVTIGLNGNYVFDSSHVGYEDGTVTLDYKVEKKLITGFTWAEREDGYLTWNDGENKDMNISGYTADFMIADYVQKDNGDVTVNLVLNTDYFINDRGLVVNINGVGTYRAVIRFNDDAKFNFKWNAGDTESNVTLSFHAATNSFKFTSLTIEGWTYLDTANDPVYKLSNGVSGLVMRYTYARVRSQPESVIYGVMLDSLEGFEFGAFTSTVPVNAGTYLVMVSFPGDNTYSSASAYSAFKIAPKTVVQNDLHFTSDGAQQLTYTTSYNGAEQSAGIHYDPTVLGFTYAGAEIDGGSITIRATDKGVYTVKFTLNDSDNYVWSEDFTPDNNSAVSLVWTMNAATDNKLKWDVDSIASEYGEGFSLTASATYNGNVTYVYATRRTNENSPAGSAVWLEIPTDGNGAYKLDAGHYWIRATGDGSDNYNQTAPVYKRLEIERATLTATAEGSVIYGEKFEDGVEGYTYSFSGFKYNEDESVVTVGEISYRLAEVPEKLEYGVYGIILASKDGEVVGMQADNYVIVAEEGIFSVAKRDVIVTVGDASSVYGQKINLEDITVTVFNGTPLVEGDGIDDLNISLEISGADLESLFNDVSSYRVTATGYTSSKNYNVTVLSSGIYTVSPLEIYITVEAGGGTYGDAHIVPAKLTGIYSAEDDTDVTEKFGALAPSFTFSYRGTANDGTAYNSTTVPNLAGNYSATAISSANRNFTLVTHLGTPGVTFVVAKRPVDESLISTRTEKFVNAPITPVIIDDKFGDLYTVGEASFTDVGRYTVALTLNDGANNRWSSVDEAVYNLPFEIVKGDNRFVGEITIKGWVYGQYDASVNSPSAQTAYGGNENIIYTYSDAVDGEYTSVLPTAAGEYWLKATVAPTDNYNTQPSDPVKFEITKRIISAPTLLINGENSTYTGSRLQAQLSGYDPSTMRIVYDGDMASGENVLLFAVNAAEYSAHIVLIDSDNYAWEQTLTDEDGNALLKWNVARKKIEKPTMNTNTFIVNGGTLTFIPVGFDENTMDIEGNKISYGGVFKVTVSIKDSVNYEWADSSVEDITFDWVVVGWDTVFIIVTSVLGVVAGIAAGAIGIQYLVHRRRKTAAIAAEQQAAQKFHENMAEAINAKSEGTAEPQPENNSGDENADGKGENKDDK